MNRAQSLLLATAVLLSAPAFHVSQARAQSADLQRTAAAQVLYDEGVKAMDAKDYATACPKLEEVVTLVPEGVGAKVSLAQCYEGAGRLASAWTAYIVAEAAAAREGQEARRKLASHRAAALRPKLATITVVVPDSVRSLAGLAIERDGIPVGQAQWGAAIPVDRGAHTVVVTAPSRPRLEKRVAIDADGAVVSVDIAEIIEQAAAEKRSPAKPHAAGKVSPKPRQTSAKAETREPERLAPTPPPTPATFWGPQRIAGVAAGGVGLAAIGVGSYFGVRAIQKKNESNDGHCRAGDFCDPIGIELRKDGLTAGTASTALFIAGGVTLAGGVVLFATAPRNPERKALHVAAVPGGLVLDGRW
jgi:hypothetical protein